jgi:hypothetical protein
MPEKFKPSEKIRDKQTGKVFTRHYYLKNTPMAELEKIVNSKAKPKLRIKCAREIQRRKNAYELFTKRSDR